MVNRRMPFVVAVVCLLLLDASLAFAHAERVGSEPEEGARVEAPPPTLSIDFSEPPIGNPTFVVNDGCERDVVEDIEIQNLNVEAQLFPGQPGRWTVQTRVISAVDGHETSDSWTFRVRGEPDCDTETPPTAAQDADDEDDAAPGGSFPLLAFAAGTLVVIAVALVVRGRSG